MIMPYGQAFPLDGTDEMPSPARSAHAWTGGWIAPAEPIGRGEWACFRRVVELDRPLARPVLRVACDTKYWLWIDDRCVVYEGQLKRGPTPTATYFDEIPLDAPLAAGPHTIAVLVWYFGKHGFAHNDSGRCGLLVELGDLDAPPAVVGDAQWRARRHPAYGPGAGPQPNFRLAEPNVAFDARLDMPGWQSAGFDDRDWPAAEPAGAAGAEPWGALVRRPIPMFRDHGVTTLLAPQRPIVSTGRTIVCPLPFNCHVHPTFELEAPAGVTVDVRTDNYLGGGHPNVRASYVTRAGRQRYESLGWMNGHALHLDVPAGVVVHRVGYRRTSYDADWVGRFDCDDARLNRLYEKSCRTLDVCMRDAYMDCPDRERAQWWGDVVIQMASAFYACDAERAPALTRKAIDELVAWRRDDAALFSPVPAGVPRPEARVDDRLRGCWDAELPAQMLASIGWHGLWTYYLYSGDRATLARAYPVAKEYLALFRVDDATGLVAHRGGDWDWIDWGENVDVPVCFNAWYALALQGLAAIADLLGDAEQARVWRAQRERLAKAFVRAFWNGDHFRGDATLPAPDDRAQAMAVVAGLAAASHRDGVVSVLCAERHAGPYMEKYIVEALLQLGETRHAVERLVGRYAAQLDNDLTTLWEGWSLDDPTWGGGTYNHAWSAGAIALCQRYLAGIEPIAPAFERFRVRPQPGALRRIRSRVPTRFGTIDVDLSRDEHVAHVVVPPGTTAEFEYGGTFATLAAGRHTLRLAPPPVALAPRAKRLILEPQQTFDPM